MCSDVVPLPHPLRRIVIFPEDLHQIFVADRFRIEDDEDDFGMAGHAGADLAVRGIRRMARGVADGGRVHAGQLPEFFLGAPETSHREHRA